MLICWKSAKVLPTAILSLCRKLGCAVWKLLEVVLDKLSLLTASHHYRCHDDFQSSQLCLHWSNACADCQSSLLFPWWLPVITIIISHDDFQSSQLCPRWNNICADFQSSLSFPGRLPAITTNGIGGIPCEEPIGVQWLVVTSHSCWLEVIGLLAHVQIKMSPRGSIEPWCHQGAGNYSNTQAITVQPGSLPIHSWVEKGHMQVKCLAYEHRTTP